MAGGGISIQPPAVIAEQDAIVETDVNGGIIKNVVKAGQPVPPHLVDNYLAQHGAKDEAKAKGKGKSKKDD